jgi:ribosomal protein L19E
VFAPSPTKDTAVASRKHGNESINGFLTAKKTNKYIWTCKRRRMLENKKKQGNKGCITSGRYCKIYKIPPTNLAWSC